MIEIVPLAPRYDLAEGARGETFSRHAVHVAIFGSRLQVPKLRTVVIFQRGLLRFELLFLHIRHRKTAGHFCATNASYRA
ncbi:MULTISPECIES: hypothetical protein [Sinorhizobium/Ensifer group]|uniref:hypothetical protein n=1 Tax=Sinorhizobium/Ensifer group TaxID=227292 RepID=UPI000987A6AD|nr:MULTISPECIES: hypothetical protein [Sinorhizobium/Ensifer group]OOG75934.1 hypothetical protein B0E45_03195 [Sinorhizobium sp. A49]